MNSLCRQRYACPRGITSRGVVLVLVSSLLVTVSSAAPAFIATNSSGITQIVAPPSVLPDALQSMTQLFSFNEMQGVTLTAPVKVDLNHPGTITSPNQIVAT